MKFSVATDLHAHIKSARYQVHRQKVNIIYWHSNEWWNTQIDAFYMVKYDVCVLSHWVWMVQFHHMQPNPPRNASLILTFRYTAAVHDNIHIYMRHTQHTFGMKRSMLFRVCWTKCVRLEFVLFFWWCCCFCSVFLHVHLF